MTPRQKDIINETWQCVVPIGDTAAKLFYDRLFEIDSSLKPLFANTDLPQQRMKLLKSLNDIVDSIDNLEALLPEIQALGRRHVAYGVRDEHYDTVGAALLWALEQGLGEAWSEEASEAWAAAYALIAEVMVDATRQPDEAIARAAL